MSTAKMSAGLAKGARPGQGCGLPTSKLPCGSSPNVSTTLAPTLKSRVPPASSRLVAAAAASSGSPAPELSHRPHANRSPLSRVSAAVVEDVATEELTTAHLPTGPAATLNHTASEGRQSGFSPIPDAVAAYARGELIVVLDDEDRENEGDLIMAAEHATPDRLAFMVRYTSGVICVGMRGEDLDRLQIPLMVDSKSNEDAMETAFTVTVDLKEGTTTGISAADRAATLRALADPNATPEMFNKPGHIFPLRCRKGGVVTRPGHTEASVDLALLGGCQPAGVLCEIVNDDGTMARTPELLEFGAQHGLHVITIKDLVNHIVTENMLP